jgi:predicted phosphodiesterase
MKICLFSDIHGNGPAFEAAYPKLLGEQADLNIFLGDLCGYYFDELEIYKILAEMPNLVALRGNHDNMFIAASGGDNDVRSEYLKGYGSALENCLRHDHQAMITWLKGRPEVYESPELDLACFHGSPADRSNGYIYPDADLSGISVERQRNFFLGHTHYPMHRWAGDKLIVNPGSLGQPRQKGWPTYAVVTLPDRAVEFTEVPYDVDRLIEQIEQRKEKNPYLKEVLLRCYA